MPMSFFLLHHRHVTKFSSRHASHQAVDSVVFRAGLYIARHDLTYRFVQHCWSMLGECAHNIALRKDPDDAMIGAKNDDRTNPLLG